MKIFFALSMFLFIGCTANQDEWTILFDGNSVSHWRGFNQENFPFDDFKDLGYGSVMIIGFFI